MEGARQHSACSYVKSDFSQVLINALTVQVGSGTPIFAQGLSGRKVAFSSKWLPQRRASVWELGGHSKLLGCNIGCKIQQGKEAVWSVSDTKSTIFGFCTISSGPGSRWFKSTRPDQSSQNSLHRKNRCSFPVKRFALLIPTELSRESARAMDSLRRKARFTSK